MTIVITRHCDDCGEEIHGLCLVLEADDDMTGQFPNSGPWHFCGKQCLKHWLAHNG